MVERISSLLSRIDWKNVALLAAAVALAAAYFKLFAIVFFIAAVVAVSFLVNQFHIRIIGIELVTFATVISGIVYGPVVGAVMGAVLVFISLVFSGFFGVYYFWLIPEYAAAGYLAWLWRDQPIAALGMNILLMVQGLNIVLTYLFARQNFFKYVVYIATELVFNFIIFSVFGAWALGVLA
ncbi:MAG: hypothetical protein HYW26_04470 [Candidatus Aenigmarchaeota archaeon]|nr:hypothetical protein [Candidatus Aenigmarchaeota archaeon]